MRQSGQYSILIVARRAIDKSKDCPFIPFFSYSVLCGMGGAAVEGAVTPGASTCYRDNLVFFAQS
jgi:hypothetical protein